MSFFTRNMPRGRKKRRREAQPRRSFGQWLAHKFMRLMGWGFTLLFTGIIIGCIAVMLVFKHYSADLPDHSTLANYDPETTTRLYAADGRLMAEYATERRVFVPLAAMPRMVIGAFLAAEDKNFYTHSGVDITGIGRAVYTNIVNYGQGRSMVGGSTITQQVVKNFLLTDEKSFERKIKEAILALRISQVYSKDKILELYLNEIFLGLRSYGVAAAALNYFNKSLDELTPEEAALLAAMPKAPSNYDPRRNADAAKQRRDWVLTRMAEDGVITQTEAEAAKLAPITLRARQADEVAKAEFFAEEVRRWLAEHYGENVLYQGGLAVKTTLEPTYQAYADHALQLALINYDRRRGYRGPLARMQPFDKNKWQADIAATAKQDHHLVAGQKIAMVIGLDAKKATIGFADGTTGTIPMAALGWTRRVLGDGVLGAAVGKPADIFTLGDVVMVGPLSDDALKKLPAAEAKTAWDLQQIPAVNGALVAMDPHTGKVLAMSGGYSYGGTEFNRATQARRQPGSSFKPFVYLAGLEAGMTPATMILDAPVEMSQGEGLPAWRPQNYKDEYFGPITMRVGLEKSRNTVTVRMAEAMGIDKVLEVGKRMGIYDQLPRNYSTVLGSAETTLLRMVNAYAMLVNGGKRVSPAMVERVDDRHGRAVYRRDVRECPQCNVPSPEAVADDMPPIPADVREQVIDPRLAYQVVSMLEGVVERGTATRAKVLARPVAGKTGTTNNSMDTWFVGFSPDLVVGVYIGFDKPQTLGKKETGGSVALPAFIQFMQDALKDVPAQPFRTPRGIQLVRTDITTGQPADAESKRVIWESFAGTDPIFIPGVSPGVAPLPGSFPKHMIGIEEHQEESAVEGEWHGEDPNAPKVLRLPGAPVVPQPQAAPPVQGTGGLY